MNFLAIETSCDETAAAVFTDELAVLSSVVASQTDLHARFGGVVPEIASRAHLRNLLPVIDEALSRAGITLKDIGCVAVHNTPGSRRRAARRRVGREDARARPGRAARGGEPHPEPHLRLPAGRGPRHLPVRRTGGERRAHRALPLRQRAVHDAPRRHARRRGRRGVRQGRGDPRARLPRRPGGRARGGRQATRRRTTSRAPSTTMGGWSSASAASRRPCSTRATGRT